MSANERILVIKLSALGDFFQALGPMKAIREYHPNAHITLLTTKSFAGFGKDCGYFDDVWIDERPKWYNFTAWGDLSKRLNQVEFIRVYDLQNNDRSRIYFKLFRAANRPEWVGTVKGGSHYNDSPERTKGPAFDGHKQTLALAGIDNIEIDRLEWMNSDVSRFGLSKDYALIVPGCAPSRPEKRWSPENFSIIAQQLLQNKIQPVLIGTKDEKEATSAIAQKCPEAIDLTDKTSLQDIAVLARGAKLTVTNDTGPAHIIGVTGCPTYVLFSTQGSSPDKHAPLGENVHKFVSDNIATIQASDVWAHIKKNIEALN